MGEPILGIDLGTSTSIVAALKHGRPTVLTDADGHGVQPSVVSFHPSGSILVGADAKKRRLIDPKNTLASFKRLIGRPFSAPEVQRFAQETGYDLRAGPNEEIRVQVRDQELAVPDVSALILHHLKIIAERSLRRMVKQAVVTVPASFNDAQRSATVTAGQLAGLDVVRVINEPTAAALAYGHGQGLDRRALVYDFGGGTFDVTILEIHGDVYEVRATAGDAYLGGDDLDARLVEYMVELCLERHRYDPRPNETAMQRLKSVAEQVKVQLSEQARSAVQIQELAYGPEGAAIDLKFELTREQLNQRVQDLVDRTFEICDQAFQLAGLRVADIDEVVLVGGTTRLPLVREAVRAYFARSPLAAINPEEVVALGAAIQAAALAGEPILPVPVQGTGRAAAPAPTAAPSRPLLLDVTPLSLGVAIVGGYTQVVIPRNTQVPVEQSREFTTGADGQTAVTIRICQGEERRFEANTVLGEVLLSGLAPAARGMTRVEVTFELDTSGILKVRAKDAATGRAQDATIRLLGQQADPAGQERLARLAASMVDASELPDAPPGPG